MERMISGKTLKRRYSAARAKYSATLRTGLASIGSRADVTTTRVAVACESDACGLEDGCEGAIVAGFRNGALVALTETVGPSETAGPTDRGGGKGLFDKNLPKLQEYQIQAKRRPRTLH